jgi:hypothetical protein
MDPKTSNEDNSLDNLDAEEAALREEAMKVDPVRPEDATFKDDTTEGEQAAPSADDTATKKAEADKKATADKAAADKTAADKASKENADKSAADKAAADKAAADKAAADKAAAEEKNLSPYEKERRRLNTSWKKLEDEKAAARKEREEFEAAKKKFEEDRAKATTAKPTPEKPKHNGFTADDYEAAAKDFKAEGKMDEAALAEKRAKELRDKEAELAKQAGDTTAAAGDFITLATGGRITKDEQKKMESEWTANLKRLGDANPDLMKEGTPLRIAVAELLKPGAHPILHSHASGIHYAVEVAKLKVAAAEVPTLKTRITELEAENKRLTELTSLNPSGGGGAQHREQPKPGQTGNLDQDENALREEAMASDARGGS